MRQHSKAWVRLLTWLSGLYLAFRTVDMWVGHLTFWDNTKEKVLPLWQAWLRPLLTTDNLAWVCFLGGAASLFWINFGEWVVGAIRGPVSPPQPELPVGNRYAEVSLPVGEEQSKEASKQEVGRLEQEQLPSSEWLSTIQRRMSDTEPKVDLIQKAICLIYISSLYRDCGFNLEEAERGLKKQIDKRSGEYEQLTQDLTAGNQVVQDHKAWMQQKSAEVANLLPKKGPIAEDVSKHFHDSHPPFSISLEGDPLQSERQLYAAILATSRYCKQQAFIRMVEAYEISR